MDARSTLAQSHAGFRYDVECWAHYHANGERCTIPHDQCPLDHRSELLWRDLSHNTVVTVGLNRLLSATLKGSSTGGASGGRNDGLRMPAKWATGTAYSVGDVVRPTNSSGQIDNNRIFICSAAGTSHASTEPTWSNTAGATVTDNTVTWTEHSVWFVGLKGSGSINAADTMASHSGWTESTAYSNSTRPTLVLGSVSAGSVDNSSNKAVFNINGTATIAGAFVCDMGTPGGNAVSGCELYGAADFSGGNRSVQSGDTLNVQVTATES